MTGGAAPAAGGPEWSLPDLKVRLAWAETLVALATAAAVQARADWAGTAMRMRNVDDTKSTGLKIGDLPLGLVKFPAYGGGDSEHGAVVERLAAEAPAEENATVRWADPSILERQDVLDTLEAFHPGLVTRKASPAWKSKLRKRLDGQGRLITDEATGEFVQVVTHHTAVSDGRITFTPEPELVPAIVGLMRSGQIDPDTVADLMPFFPVLTAIPGHAEPDAIEAPRAEAA